MKTNYTNYIHSILKMQQHRVQLGLDQANRKIRFTKGEVDPLSGEFAAPLVGNAQQQCLPQADGELPGQNAIPDHLAQANHAGVLRVVGIVYRDLLPVRSSNHQRRCSIKAGQRKRLRFCFGGCEPHKLTAFAKQLMAS
ncbi:MAG: hypothetical protein NXI32_14060 [bacterium]|nr:hypothetical protein [bacterium]